MRNPNQYVEIFNFYNESINDKALMDEARSKGINVNKEVDNFCSNLVAFIKYNMRVR
jgi:hypothetical protein